MENSLLLFLTTAIAALALENAVFARGLGLGKSTLFMDGPGSGILLGALFTGMATVSSLLVALSNYLLRGNPYILILRPIAYLAGVLLVYAATILLTRRFLKNKKWARRIRKTLPYATFNSALFAAFYISASQNFLFSQTVGYALGAGIGYTLALLVIYYARKRLSISPVPRAFRGVPVLLIYLGLISLALYGLIGHNLPT